MAGQVICHAIGDPGSFSAGRMIEAAELAFSAISHDAPRSFASQYQDLGAAAGELCAPAFGTAA
jgi:hypothetical protein